MNTSEPARPGSHGPRVAILVVMGTRPEAIKLAPVVEALRVSPRLRPIVLATSQHRDMLRQALAPFGVTPDVDLDVMTEGQTPIGVAARVLERIERPLRDLRPAFVLVQGDTTTALAAAWAAFYAGVPVGHVEAGLRSGDLAAPFPEEFNRRAVAAATSLHLAPTPRARENLMREGVAPERIAVVGNTIVDAIHRILAPRSRAAAASPATVLVTMHRRESFGAPLERALGAIRRLAAEEGDALRVVLPVHPNPNVSGPVRRILGGLPNVSLREPMDYPEFLDLFAAARLVISDSGGVQEESPTLRVPVLITRDTTERPEVLESGWGVLVGTDPDRILTEARIVLHGSAAARPRGANPFGDGCAAPRIVRLLEERAAPSAERAQAAAETPA